MPDRFFFKENCKIVQVKIKWATLKQLLFKQENTFMSELTKIKYRTIAAVWCRQKCASANRESSLHT